MKLKRSLLLLALALCYVCCLRVPAAKGITIEDVQITPDEPTPYHIITIDVSGWVGYTGPQVEYTEFSSVDTSLQLDMFFLVGDLPAVTPWSYSEDISALDVGSYTLTVRAFEWPYTEVGDTYVTSFDVVPEPATLLLLASGIMGIRVCRHRRSGNPCIKAGMIV